MNTGTATSAPKLSEPKIEVLIPATVQNPPALASPTNPNVQAPVASSQPVILAPIVPPKVKQPQYVAPTYEPYAGRVTWSKSSNPNPSQPTSSQTAAANTTEPANLKPIFKYDCYGFQGQGALGRSYTANEKAFVQLCGEAQVLQNKVTAENNKKLDASIKAAKHVHKTAEIGGAAVGLVSGVAEGAVSAGAAYTTAKLALEKKAVVAAAELTASKFLANQAFKTVDKKTAAAFSEASEVLVTKDGLSAAGRSLQKHGARQASLCPVAKGNITTINLQAKKIVDEILNHPASTIENRTNKKWGEFIDIFAPYVRGLRYKNGEFIGFL